MAYNTWLILFFSIFSIGIKAQNTHICDTILMGSPFRITIVEPSQEKAHRYINKAIDEIIRIENIISEWQPHTEVSEINHQAGIKPVKVSQELINLTKTALYFSKLTNGAFDISIISMDKIWKFDGSMTQLPPKKQIRKAIRLVSYKNIIINEKEQTIFLKNKGMKIGFGSIGKGYAADRARLLLRRLGVTSGIVDASGDISLFGEQQNGSPWRIGINHPTNEIGLADILSLKNASVATSGDYEKYALIDGTRYGHIINPATGYPSQGIISVSIIGKEATIANGLSTSIMVLGIEKGLQLLKHFPQYTSLIITQKGNIIKAKNYHEILTQSQK